MKLLPVINTPTAAAVLIATMIDCSRDPVRLLAASCARRWSIANGHAEADAGVAQRLRTSNCNGCPEGQARAGESGAKPVAMVKCSVCGTEFPPVRSRGWKKVYCQKACSNAAAHKRALERRTATAKRVEAQR